MIQQKSSLKLPALNAVDFQIIHTESYPHQHTAPDLAPHIHHQCEIYINLSGDISFFCNDHIYPMTRGDLLIARPGEYHHCIYRSNAAHQHYWILFDYEPNRHIWNDFFPQPFENVLRPSPAQKEELLETCRILNQQDLPRGERFFHFCNLLTIIRKSNSVARADHLVPKDFISILDYINTHIHEKLTVSSLAEQCFVSTSTMERYFLKYTNTRPAAYIRHKKLTEALSLLQQGYSVFQTAERLGYCDESYFIELFKKQFGATPLQYKKAQSEE